MELLVLAIAIILALGVTALFIYGAWLLLRYPTVARKRIVALARSLHLIREDENPLITPGGSDWEAQGVLNPAAVEVDGTMHLFYRAIGKDGVSRVGYASSENGKRFAKLPYPVFALSDEGADAAFKRAQTMKNHAALVASGGSFAGVEDPRAVVMDDRVYMTFSAFGGWDSLRMGVTSLALDDLRAHRWRWTPPVYLSPRSQVHKNWVLFPEKVGGKYAVLHSMHGDSHDQVRVDYIDSLEKEPDITFTSSDPNSLPDNPHSWHKRVRGAGPPPIKTPLGWLVLYHAIDRIGPSKYKLGALLLDLADPTRVLHRSAAPVLSPDAWYENAGAKAGVVYACGSVLRGDLLTVFYGGADSVVCSARHSLSKLLDSLTQPPVAERSPFLPMTGMVPAA